MATQAALETELSNKLEEVERMHRQIQLLKRKSKQYEYNGPQRRVRVRISDKVFISSTKILCNKKNGNNLFIREILGIKDDDDDMDDVKVDAPAADEGAENGMKDEAKESSNGIEIFFDRDPIHFPMILNYLRGYNMDQILHDFSVRTLQSILDDAVFYKISGLIQMVSEAMHSRFDPRFCHPLMEMNANGIVVTRSATNVSLHLNAGVYGVHREGRRYVEFQLLSHGNRYIMIGVTEGDNFRMCPYPGSLSCRGCAYYGANGNLYRNHSSEAWGGSLSYGDICGVLVDINGEQSTATIVFYVNGKKVKEPIDLKQFMDVDKGVVFVANAYAANEQVAIVQSAQPPM